MNVKDLFDKCLTQADTVMKQVRASQFGLPTPDTEWDVRKLVGHILYELAWVPDLMAGQTVAAVGTKYDGDLIGSDLQVSWRSLVDKALAAVKSVDSNQMVHLSYADVPAANFIQEQANDQLIHAWDLATAIGVPIKFDEQVAEELYQAALPRQAEMASSGLFGTPVQTPASADVQTKLLRVFGRESK